MTQVAPNEVAKLDALLEAKQERVRTLIDLLDGDTLVALRDTIVVDNGAWLVAEIEDQVEAHD